MEIKVKDVSGVDSKSVQEVENELLEKHEQETSGEVNESSGETSSESNDESAVEQEIEQKELNEEDVLSYINSRYDRKIDTVEQLFEAREESEEMPEDVSAYLKNFSKQIKTESYSKNLDLYFKEGLEWMKNKYGFNNKWQMHFYVKMYYDQFFDYNPELEAYKL